jgi:hypothetical protein
VSSNRSLLFIAAGILALVVLAVAVVLLAGVAKPQEFPPDSPEAALQDYLAAWDGRDIPAAYLYFSERVRSTTTLDEYQLAADEFAGYGMPPNGPDRRAFIDEVTGSGDRVVVQLTVEELYGDGLNTNVQRSTRSVPMVREPDGWRIDEPLGWLDPMPVYEYPK